MLTGRQAEEVLGRRAGLTRRHARRVLAAGLAGPQVRVGRLTLHDPDRVRELTERSFVDESEVEAATPELLVLRRDGDDLAVLAEGWDLSAYTRVALRLRIDRCGGALPVVATTAGFVTCGAGLVDVVAGGRHGSLLRFTDPGSWFEVFDHRRYATGPGRPWWLRGWHPSAET